MGLKEQLPWFGVALPAGEAVGADDGWGAGVGDEVGEPG